MKRGRENLRPEVKEAVDDLMKGTSKDSLTEWLQREYVRMMLREVNEKKNESKLEKNNNTNNDGKSSQ
tara:strand:- start:181 stop:384 length:204 start_codon:yes stop_codon:yes gene_type:complete